MMMEVEEDYACSSNPEIDGKSKGISFKHNEVRAEYESSVRLRPHNVLFSEPKDRTVKCQPHNHFLRSGTFTFQK